MLFKKKPNLADYEEVQMFVYYLSPLKKLKVKRDKPFEMVYSSKKVTMTSESTGTVHVADDGALYVKKKVCAAPTWRALDYLKATEGQPVWGIWHGDWDFNVLVPRSQMPR